MISGEWASIIPWSTENPNLYVAKLELKNPEGKIVQTRETRTGFRTVEFFPQDGVYLNGTKLVVKGINRHSFSVDGGRTTSAALSRMDALLIKEMNMNAVRSHYPPMNIFLICATHWDLSTWMNWQAGKTVTTPKSVQNS